MRSNIVKRIGCLELVPLKDGEIGFCENHFSVYEGRKMASSKAYIMGLSAGGLCTPCAKEWLKSWKSITGKSEIHEKFGKKIKVIK